MVRGIRLVCERWKGVLQSVRVVCERWKGVLQSVRVMCERWKGVSDDPGPAGESCVILLLMDPDRKLSSCYTEKSADHFLLPLSLSLSSFLSNSFSLTQF